MGERVHKMNAETDGGPPNCTHCDVEAIVRQGRYVCPIAWREQHVSRKRSEHVISAYQGLVSCSCGGRVQRLDDGMWVCTTQMPQIERGKERQRRIWGDAVDDARELGATPSKNKDLTDYDMFGVDPVPHREYKPLSAGCRPRRRG